MLELKPGVVLSLGPGIVLHSLADQDLFFAFNVVTGDQYRLNRTSFWVLEAIGEGIEWLHLKDAFLRTFEIAPEQGDVDLRDLINEFYQEEIIGR